MRFPPDHPQRRALADELHARPATPVTAPAVVSCLALHEADAGVVIARLSEVARLHAAEPVDLSAAHAVIELGGGRLRWERHGEFVSLLLVRVLPGASLETLEDFPTAFSLVSEAWLASLPGRVIAAADVLVLTGGLRDSSLDAARRWFVTDSTAASFVLDDVARVLTDFVVRDNGRTRWMVLDSALSRAQVARVVQRIVEIEVYRMMALLAFPRAREAFGELRGLEHRLATVMNDMSRLHTSGQATEAAERRQLDELTRMAAEAERSIAASNFRFSSARAYWEIVQARLAELRERRIGDMRTLSGFLGRRMTPAMKSVEAAARRQEALSTRIERASALLRTRVDVAREEQNQRLLAAMERRGKVQLRLQEAVEGLSVAAITYYVVALVAYALKPMKHVPHLNADWVAAGSIPVVALMLHYGLKRRLRG